jgi:hypothetical protein
VPDEFTDAIRREHQRLSVDGADLRRRHEVLEQQPFDHNEHAAHVKRLRAHLEALHLYLASLSPQGRT